ncbi:protein FAR1-RELATED SEQUENCE 5-like [Tasmannia lanceolata]|uniref:protein FAR1-RELATED SEQUENCE 5-like n=1 Tax=Tasmannia lanceolata TaxID=3420 RepID=UPI004062FB77
MPFAPLNHHRQSALFGCALLADKTEETFTWLFEQWLRCMFGKAPGCIITDMNGAMRNAIQRKKISDSEMVEKYNIGEKDRLAKMWQLRSHWVPVYFRGTFIAGMVSNSRSESINALFDGFVNQNTTLQEFVQQYDRALVARHKFESQEDFNTKSTKAGLKGKNRLEAQAADCYTRAFDDPIWKWSKVVYEELKKRSTSIPAKYILHRWTTGARYHVGGGVPAREENSDDATPLQKWCLIGKHQRLLEEMQ